MDDEFHFEVLEDVERLPGYYMYQDGELVPYGPPYPSEAILLERWTIREIKNIIDKFE